MVPLRKRFAGGTSLGYDWPTDGSVVEVPDAVAVNLLAIKDGGFSVAEALPVAEPDVDPGPTHDDPVTEPDPEPGEITEPDPGPAEPVVEAKPAAKKTAVRRTSPKA